MKYLKNIFFTFLILTMINYATNENALEIEVFETSASGNLMKKITTFSQGDTLITLSLIHI